MYFSLILKSTSKKEVIKIIFSNLSKQIFSIFSFLFFLKVLALLQSSAIIDDYWFFVSITEESTFSGTSSASDKHADLNSSSHFRFIYISESLGLLSFDIFQSIDYSYANFYALQSCVYKITVEEGKLQSN